MSKRILTVGALLAAIVMAGQGVQAKTLEDILKEKGVITQADYNEIVKSKEAEPKPIFKALDYKLGKGFTVTSTDEKFQLNIGGRLLARYTFTDKNEKQANLSLSGSPSVTVANRYPYTLGKDTSSFSIAKAQLWFGGYAYTKDLTYMVAIDVASASNPTAEKVLEQAWANYRLLDEVQFRVGAQKPVFSRAYQSSTGNLEFVAVSGATTGFVPTYDTGVALNGKVLGGLITYEAGIYGGLGQTKFRSNSSGNALFAHVSANPLGDFAYSEGDLENSPKPKVTAGASYWYDTLASNGAGVLESNNLGFANTSTGWLGRSFNTSYLVVPPTFGGGTSILGMTDKIHVNTLGLDAAFKWRGFFVQGEYYWGSAESKTTNRAVYAQGFYTQAGYCILPGKLEVAMRYSYMDPNMRVRNDLQTEVTGAVSYYFNKHNLKLQADIGNQHTQQPANFAFTGANSVLNSLNYTSNVGVLDSMIYRLQLAVVF